MQDSSAGSWALRKRKLFALMAWDCDYQFIYPALGGSGGVEGDAYVVGANSCDN